MAHNVTFLEVKYTQNKDCFCQIKLRSPGCPQNLMGDTEKLTCMKVQTEQGAAYLSVNNVTAISGSSTDSLHLNGVFANKLGIRQNQKVLVEVVEQLNKCTSAHVEPLTVDDWEILELNSNYIQSCLMNQVRVIWPGVELPIWLPSKTCIFIRIGACEPTGTSAVILEQLTELIITPKDRKPPAAAAVNKSSTLPFVSSTTTGDLLMPPVPRPDQRRNKSDPAVSSSELWSGGLNLHPSRTSSGYGSNTTDEMSVPTGIMGRLKSWFSGDNAVYGLAGSYEPTSTRSHQQPRRIAPAVALSLPSFKQARWGQYDFKPLSARLIIESSITKSGWWDGYTSICCVRADMFPDAPANHFLANLSLLTSPLDIESEAKNSAKLKRRTRAAKPDAKSTEKNIATVCVVLRGPPKDAPHIPPGHLVLDKRFCQLHKIKVTSRLKLTPVTKLSDEKPGSIQIQPVHTVASELVNKDTMKTLLHKHICELQEKNELPIVLSNVTIITLRINSSTSADFLLLAYPPQTSQKTSPTSPSPSLISLTSMETIPSSEEEEDAFPSYYSVYAEDFGMVKIIPEELVTARCKFDLLTENMVRPVSPIIISAGFPAVYESCLHFIKSTLITQCEGGLLLTGVRGCGKTTLVYQLLTQLYKEKHCYTHRLDCKLLRGKRPDAMKKLVDTVIQECMWREPSVLFIDDLDILCRAPAGPEDEANPEIIFGAKISEVLRDGFSRLWSKKSRVALIATALSKNTVNTNMTRTHGHHVFYEITEIPALTQATRTDLLEAIIKSYAVETWPSQQELSSISHKLEGCVARDLSNLVKRALHANTINTSDYPVKNLRLEDLNAALDGFTPANIRGVTLHTPGNQTWKDVGGLHNIKEQLAKMLEWPAKYRKLYAQCPIRMQSGVLLYGAPGTGKTLVAAVIAKEMGLNFISIKGPELLNKYIGSSEQAVRNTFAKAESVRPCILFFDEFESLAPRRGHDSTGVTDRVVNQLLTQLDGVEALEGVFVLAATSRPDLIDPALLRPGRLDKSLCCEMPTYEDRIEILEALTHNLHISADVKFEEIAEKTVNCTGADLKALLVNAQLDAVHEFMDTKMIPTGHRRTSVVDLSEEFNRSTDTTSAFKAVVKPSIDQDCQAVTPASACYKMVQQLMSQPRYSPETPQKPKQRKHRDSHCDHVITIEQWHIETALCSLQPSVSRKEQLQYQKIYDQFNRKRGSTSADTRIDQVVTSLQRVSLA